MNLFAIVAIACLIISFFFGGFFVYFRASEGVIKVGDLVRTTFTACPAALTSALWGPNKNYNTSATYGFHFEDDAVNALHCDMPQGYWTHSTWISDGGQSYFMRSLTKYPQLYLLQATCSTDADCSRTTMQCGPGYAPGEPGTVDPGQGGASYGAGASRWLKNYGGSFDPAQIQCAPNTYCSLCKTSFTGGTQYCLDDEFRPINGQEVGVCLSTVQKEELQFSCTTPYENSTLSFCAAVLPADTTGYPDPQRLTSCSLALDYGNLSYSQNNVVHYCLESLSGQPYFCSFSGNVSCFPGQQCVANWGSQTGWCSPSEECSDNYETATNVCSGTILPTIVLQTPWIAEGTVTSLANGSYSVQWDRIQNTYQGIGPSDTWCNSGTSNCALNPGDTNDLSWRYNDCKFVRAEDYAEHLDSRHATVASALLGSSLTNPIGLNIFSTSNASYSDVFFQRLLRVGAFAQGEVSDDWRNVIVPYIPTAWNLRATGLPKSSLKKIWAYSIHPFHKDTESVQYHHNNHSGFFAEKPSRFG